jgi:hypothetical protein
VSAVLLLETITAVPLAGAACEMLTVHVALPPAGTVFGVQLKPVTVAVGGVTVRAVVTAVPFNAALTDTA